MRETADSAAVTLMRILDVLNGAKGTVRLTWLLPLTVPSVT
jgi:hypothetical protein